MIGALPTRRLRQFGGWFVLGVAAFGAEVVLLGVLHQWLRCPLWLASAVVAGAFVWGVVMLAQTGGAAGDWSSALFVHVALQLALAAVFMALEPHLATPDHEATPDWIATAALAALSVLAILGTGLLVALAAGISSTADLIRATSACFIAVYVLALASAVRILGGRLRAAAAIALGLVTVVAFFSSISR